MSFGEQAAWVTPAAILILRDEWTKGTSTAEIGRLLGVSKNAIVSKAHRLDLEARPSPIRRTGEPAIPAQQRPVVRVTLPPLSSEMSPLPPAPRPVIAAPTPRPTPTPIPSAGDCCWPITERPYRYCDAPTVGRLPYCSVHWRLGHVKVREAAGEPAHSGGDD